MRISDWSSDVCSSDLYRGGGRSSARETAMRVAAGGIARKVLDHVLPQPVSIRGALVQMGPHRIERANWDWGAIEQNPFWCPDATAAKDWEDYQIGRASGRERVGQYV